MENKKTLIDGFKIITDQKFIYIDEIKGLVPSKSIKFVDFKSYDENIISLEFYDNYEFLENGLNILEKVDLEKLIYENSFYV